MNVVLNQIDKFLSFHYQMIQNLVFDRLCKIIGYNKFQI
jgi:hypothetical protein